MAEEEKKTGASCSTGGEDCIVKRILGGAGIWIALGLIVGAFIIGGNLGKLKTTGNITVKGLSETEHNATLAIWDVYVKDGYYRDYEGAYNAAMADSEKVVGLLKEAGFEDSEISLEFPTFQDVTESYKDSSDLVKYKTVGKNYSRLVKVKTKKLDLVNKAYGDFQKLKSKYSFLSPNEVAYYLENLDDIKLSMIGAATENAHKRAEEFLKISGNKVGALLDAKQGSFNIYGVDSSDEDEDYGGVVDTKSVKKRVRLVVTVRYDVE